MRYCNFCLQVNEPLSHGFCVQERTRMWTAFIHNESRKKKLCILKIKACFLTFVFVFLDLGHTAQRGPESVSHRSPGEVAQTEKDA